MRFVINEIALRKLIRNIIYEAMMPEFSFDELKSKSFEDRMRYCRKMFGKDIGRGSSRIVYQIDDQWVLKLAWNEKGIAQNAEEYRIAMDTNSSPLSIHVHRDGSDTDNFEWLVSEFALPAKGQDFNATCGVNWIDVILFVGHIDRKPIPRIDDENNEIYDKYKDNESAMRLFNAIYEYKTKWDGAMGDVVRLDSWGMVMRKDGPAMVLLDMGASLDIINKYYRKQ